MVQTRSQARSEKARTISLFQRLPPEVHDEIWPLVELERQVHRVECVKRRDGIIVTINESNLLPISLLVCHSSRASAFRRRYRRLPRTFYFSPRKPNPIQTKEFAVCDVKKDYLYIDNKLPFDINPWAEFENIIVESSKSNSNRITFSSFPNLKKVVNGVRLTPHMAHGRLLSIGKPCCSPRLDILKGEGRWLSKKPRWMDQARESYESPGDVEGIPFMVHNLMFGKPDDFYEVALTQASELDFRVRFCLIRAVCCCPSKPGQSDPCCPSFWESTTSEGEGLQWGGRDLILHRSLPGSVWDCDS